MEGDNMDDEDLEWAYQEVTKQEWQQHQDHMELAHHEIQGKLFFRACKIAEASFFWRFLPLYKRMDILENIYLRLKRMLEI